MVKTEGEERKSKKEARRWRRKRGVRGLKGEGMERKTMQWGGDGRGKLARVEGEEDKVLGEEMRVGRYRRKGKRQWWNPVPTVLFP